MDKRIILSILSLLFCNFLFSQQVDDEFQIPDIPKSYTLSVAPSVGIGMAQATNASSYNHLHSGVAFQLGMNCNIHFGHRYESSLAGTGVFGLGMGMAYECRKPKTEYGTITMHCVEIPVLCHYYPVASLASEFALEAGMTLVKVIKCTPDQIQFSNTIYQVGQLKSADIMLTLGARYQTPYNIVFDLRYNLGTSPLAGNIDSKLSTMVLSLEYKL